MASCQVSDEQGGSPASTDQTVDGHAFFEWSFPAAAPGRSVPTEDADTSSLAGIEMQGAIAKAQETVVNHDWHFV